MDAYIRIAGVIRYLDECHPDQPDLSALARRARLSPWHFHRLFTSWAGVTPKDFLQCLTVSGAKQLLREGKSVLDTALDSGLSGPGRLHDLCLNLEAASPGELKSGGAGWKLSAGFANTPFGRCLIAQSPRGVCHLAFVDSSTAEAWAELQSQWPRAGIHRDDGEASRLARQIFSRSAFVHRPGRSALRACVAGTAFQVRVWRALFAGSAWKTRQLRTARRGSGRSCRRPGRGKRRSIKSNRLPDTLSSGDSGNRRCRPLPVGLHSQTSPAVLGDGTGRQKLNLDGIPV